MLVGSTAFVWIGPSGGRFLRVHPPGDHLIKKERLKGELQPRRKRYSEDSQNVQKKNPAFTFDSYSIGGRVIDRLRARPCLHKFPSGDKGSTVDIRASHGEAPPNASGL